MQNIARESRLALSHRRIILPFSLSGILSYLFLRVGFYPTLSYLILLYPTLSYFFAHTMISLGGKLLKCLLYAKALLRGERSAQLTEGFQTSPIADSKQNGITPCEAAVPSQLHGMEAVQNIARLASGTGESGETITRAKYCTGKPSYFIPPQNYPTAFFSGRILSYFILLFRSHLDFPWGKAFEVSAAR